MSGQALGVDHVGIVGRDLHTLAVAFTRLGFLVTPAAHHAGGRTGNHCVMLHGSYLELVSTLPCGVSTTLARFLARYAGAHILALWIDDEGAASRRLGLAGFPALPAIATERAVDPSDPASPVVGFVLLTPPDPAEGRVHLIRHRAPEMMWQARFMTHPNRVVGLASVEIVVAEPAVTAAWFSRVSGRPVVPDRSGGFALDLPEAPLRMIPPDSAAVGSAIGPPWIRGLTLLTDDGNDALRAILSQHGTAHHIDGDAVILRQDDLILRFEPSASRSER